MNFEVTILGSGSAIPTSRRNPTSQFVECCGRYILIDCGEGAQLSLRRKGIKFQRIEHILISHLHGDHYFGLVGLLSTMNLLGRVKPVDIYGPEGLESVIRLQLELGHSNFGYEVNVHELKEGEVETLFADKFVEIRTFPLMHKIPTHGFRIIEKEKPRKLDDEKAREDGVLIQYYHRLKLGEDVETDDGRVFKSIDYTAPGARERSYAFCSDTCYLESLIDHVAGVDVLYHEATFVEALRDRAEATKHSTAVDAANIAKKAGVKKLLMGHLSARYDSGEEHLKEAKPIFDNCVVVEDGDVYTI